MRKNVILQKSILLLLSLLLILLSSIACSQNVVQNHEPATMELINILKENPDLQQLLIRSIDMAKEINPDKNTNPAQSMEDYFLYLDWAVKAMPWNALHSAQEIPSLFEAIDQSLNYFYWLLDQPLPELEGHGYYYNSVQYYPALQPWLVSFVMSWGDFLSTEESWNAEYYEKMRTEPLFNLDSGWYEDPSNWKTWNDFFSRALSSPDVRPIAAPDDNSIVISPGDSEPQGVWRIDINSQLEPGFEVKSTKYLSVANLLSDYSTYSEIFASGNITHTFLNVQDYHRFHFPVGGTIKEVLNIPAQAALGGNTIWDGDTERYHLIITEPGWQTIQTRGLVVIDTHDYGYVAVQPVGMSQISSVIFEDTVVVDAEVKKGDPLGRFLFGGSDIIMIFEEKAGFEITVPASGKVHEHVLMGQEYGKLNKN